MIVLIEAQVNLQNFQISTEPNWTSSFSWLSQVKRI